MVPLSRSGAWNATRFLLLNFFGVDR